MSSPSQNPMPTPAGRLAALAGQLPGQCDLVRLVGDDGQAMNLSVHGEITFRNSVKFRDELQKLMDTHAAPRLVLNLEQVPFIDSSGCAVLVSIARRLRNVSRQVCLLRPQPRVVGLLEITRLTTILPIGKEEIAVVN